MEYLVETQSPEVKKELQKKCKKLGRPKALTNFFIVETDNPEELEKIDGVIAVEPDEKVQLNSIQENPKSWALPYICGKDNVFKYSRTGQNVDIYIMDTGVRPDHVDLRGRVQTLYSYDGREYISKHSGHADHGTNSASCAAGTYFGMAKEANIYNLRYRLTRADGLKILDTVLEHHLNKKNPSILNMSFGGPSRIIHDGLKQLYQKGVILVAAAGNDDTDGPSFPAGNDFVISVMANDKRDRPSNFTNYGPQHDLFAPGTQILAASIRSQDAYTYTSGTSFSCPYVAGAIALMVEGSTIQSSVGVDKVKELLLNNCWKDDLHFSRKYRTSNNLLLNSNFDNNIINDQHIFNVYAEGVEGMKVKEVFENDVVKFRVKQCSVSGDNPGGKWEGEFFVSNPITKDCKFIFG